MVLQKWLLCDGDITVWATGNLCEGIRIDVFNLCLSYSEDDIIYGDFWVNVPQRFAAEIADGVRLIFHAEMASCCSGNNAY